MYWSVLNKKRVGYVWAVEIFFIIGKIYFKLKIWYIKGYLLNGIINYILWRHFWNKLGDTMQLCVKYGIEICVTFTYWFFIIWKIYFKLKFWYIKGYILNGIINNILWRHFWIKLGVLCNKCQLCMKYGIEIGVTFTYWFFIIWKIYFKLKFW